MEFRSGDIEFVRRKDRIEVTDAVLAGDTVGGSARGYIYTDSRQYDITGTYVPMFGLNNIMGKLLGPQWQDSFEAVCCGEDTQRKKPDPEVYLLALRRLGLAAQEALAIEDSAPGARAAAGAAVPLLLRPSVYFPARQLPPDLPAPPTPQES